MLEVEVKSQLLLMSLTECEVSNFNARLCYFQYRNKKN